MSISDNNSIATPTRILIVLGVLMAVVVISIIMLGVFCWSVTVQPEHIAKVTKQIVDIEEPLPSPWKYDSCYEILPTRSVKIKNSATDTTVTLQQANMPGASDAIPHMDMGPPGTQHHYHDGSTWTEEPETAETVGSRSIVMGRESGITKSGYESREHGTIVISEDRVVDIFVSERGKRQYDPSLPTPIFKAIKGFTH